MRRRDTVVLLAASALISVALVSAALAIDRIGLSARDVVGFGVRVGAFELKVEGLEGGRQSLHARLDALRLPAPVAGIGAARVDCAQARIEADAIHCRAGRFQLDWDVLDRASFVADVSARFDGSAFDLHARGIHLAGGRADLRLDGEGGTLRVRLDAHDADLAALADLATRFGATLADWSVGGGRGDIELDLTLRDGRPTRVAWSLTLRDLALSNGAGTLASDGAELTSEGRVQWPGGRADVDTRVTLRRGQFYVDPVFVELTDTPIELHLAGRERGDGWELREARVDDPGHLRLSARGTLERDWRPRDLSVRVTDLALGPGYRRYLQPVLLDGALSDLDLAGNLAGELRLDHDGLAALRIDLERGDLDDRGGRFGVYGLHAAIDWRRDEARESRIAWNGAHLFALDLGAVDWRVRGDGRALRLETPARLPVLDGALVIDTLAARQTDSGPETVFEGILEPVALRALSHAFGWPSMNGKVSGVIPSVVYRDARLVVDGVLLIRAFDGHVTLRDLRIEEPFGIAPALHGNMAIKGLDLESLTRTFAFGEITGRLDGWVRDLRMVDWQPIEFDAGFVTPEDDDSRHRISQRAIDNITALGGVSGVLSRTFMGFFETFSYDRLGLTCRLRNTVCAMGGVLPVDDDGRRYYIVKGGGLPRINVIGFAQRVDWPTLLERIRRIHSGGGPQIR